MLPVPAGDATLLIDRSAGRPHTVLIDAGLAQDEVVSYLQSVGVYHLDLVILSHPDLDHLQGLISLLENDLITIGQVWCFDLAFLREFVTTGKIPRPRKPTHEVVYLWLLRTLDGMDRALKTFGKKNVLTLQVSEGHRLSLGSLYIEVLHPWDGFYNALRSPARIKELLAKKWPADWTPPERARTAIERERPASARKVTASQEQDMLDTLLDGLDSPDSLEAGPQPLATPEKEDASEPEEEPEGDDECLPISKVGTLYNNLSIVAKIHVLGGVNPPTMLFPGDLADWTYLLGRRFPDLSADVFKYPHHGSTRAGISRRALSRFGFPFLRCCPCGPWCFPECCEWHHDFWHRLGERVASLDASDLFAEVVRPEHTLVFPYPSQGLPEEGALGGALGSIHANRADEDLEALADAENDPTPRVLEIGRERHQIRLLSSGATTRGKFINPWEIEIPEIGKKREQKDEG
jgi:hypothetical protein